MWKGRFGGGGGVNVTVCADAHWVCEGRLGFVEGGVA